MIGKAMPCARLTKVLAAIVLILIAGFFLAQKKARSMEESRVALIDVVGNNYIFRGANPFEDRNGDTVFSYEKLTSEFNKTLTKTDLKPLQDYYLIDFSLLDVDQFFVLKKEQDFFNSHPERGTFQHVSTVSPRMLLTPFDSDFAGTVTNDYNSFVAAMLERIHNLALSQKDKKVVIYVHCNSGRDRTGFFAATYRMLYKGMTRGEAIVQNVKDAGRSSEGFYDSAIKSYCRYLVKFSGKSALKLNDPTSQAKLTSPLMCADS